MKKVQSSKLSNFFSHCLVHGPDSGACNVGSAGVAGERVRRASGSGDCSRRRERSGGFLSPAREVRVANARWRSGSGVARYTCTQENLNNIVKCCVDIDLSNINSAETRQAKYELKEVRTTFIKKLIFKRVTNNIHNYNIFYMYYCIQ